MNEPEYRAQALHVDALARHAGAPESDYYRGYRRGLRRRYYGDRFGTAEDHRRHLAAAHSDDVSRAAMGRGYRDGADGAEPAP